MTDESAIFSAERDQQDMQTETILLAPNGLGYGEGGISYEARAEELGQEGTSKIDELIRSDEILVPVSTNIQGEMIDDDGCGDGRGFARVFQGAKEKLKSLHRPKVFGGGVTMTVAAEIGLGNANGKTLRQTFSKGISTLRDKMIDFGAHTDTLAHGNNCGCGAIDKAPTILANTVKYREQIRGSIEALGVDTTGLDEVEANYADYASSELGEYGGSDVMKEIVDNGKIVKELHDDHKEVAVVLNLIEGYTVDQEKVRSATDGKAQVFAVDVWRVKQLADRVYYQESEAVRHKAFLSKLVYTLATAATLTAGDLPVYIKQPLAA